MRLGLEIARLHSNWTVEAGNVPTQSYFQLKQTFVLSFQPNSCTSKTSPVLANRQNVSLSKRHPKLKQSFSRSSEAKRDHATLDSCSWRKICSTATLSMLPCMYIVSRLPLPVSRLHYSFERSKRFHRWWQVAQQLSSNPQVGIEGESRKLWPSTVFSRLVGAFWFGEHTTLPSFNLASPVDLDFLFKYFRWCTQMCKRMKYLLEQEWR